MVFGRNAVQDLGGCHLRWIEVGHGYHKGGSSWIFAKFSHCYSTHHVNVYFPTTSQFLLRVFWLPECDFSLCPINVWVFQAHQSLPRNNEEISFQILMKDFKGINCPLGKVHCIPSL